jgi:hypothetical protein
LWTMCAMCRAGEKLCRPDLFQGLAIPFVHIEGVVSVRRAK